MKQILSSDVLPQHMQDELASLQKTLEGKYGAAACIVGTAMENMSTVVNIIRHSATMVMCCAPWAQFCASNLIRLWLWPMPTGITAPVLKRNC
jgi:hypothetical protein